MARTNVFGVTDDIPADVKREVRQRCKFRCVMCSAAIYHYEHIVPFTEIRNHEADDICCLCGHCHDKVTRGLLSKETVRSRYEEISATPVEALPPVRDEIDYGDPTARLSIEGVRYQPGVQTVVRAFGADLVRIEPPGVDGRPSTVSARLLIGTDEVLVLEENAWLGSSAAFDLEVVGKRVTVRSGLRQIPLKFRLEPPHGLAIERLDMRIGHAHLLATEHAWALGARRAGVWTWLTTGLDVRRAVSHGVVFEVDTPEELNRRKSLGKGLAQEAFIIGDDRYAPALRGGVGVLWADLGFSVASWCDHFDVGVPYTFECSPSEMLKTLLSGKLDLTPRIRFDRDLPNWS